MRDIRRDLQDRAHLLEEEMTAAQVQFEKKIEQLKAERDVRIQELKDELNAIGRLIEAEQRRMDGNGAAQPAQNGAANGMAAGQNISSGQQAMGDFLMRVLTENGPMSFEDLRRWSMQEGFFNDPEQAGRGIQSVLMAIVKSGRVRQLPNGTFAPALLMDTIRQQRQAI